MSVLVDRTKEVMELVNLHGYTGSMDLGTVIVVPSDVVDLMVEVERLKEERNEARAWAGKLWCRILVEKEQNAAAIVWAYKAARGATREACALVCEAEGRQHPGVCQVFANILAMLIRDGDGVILSKRADP